jgi:hypothetical protein
MYCTKPRWTAIRKGLWFLVRHAWVAPMGSGVAPNPAGGEMDIRPGNSYRRISPGQGSCRQTPQIRSTARRATSFCSRWIQNAPRSVSRSRPAS